MTFRHFNRQSFSRPLCKEHLFRPERRHVSHITLNDLESLRKRAGYTEIEMAKAMMIALPAYEKIIGGKIEFSRFHKYSVLRASIHIAFDKCDASFAHENVRRKVYEAIVLLAGGDNADMEKYKTDMTP